MRVAFGMFGFLVVIGVIVWIMSAIWLPSAKQSLDIKKKIEPQVQQMSGHDASGRDARDSIKLDASSKNGKIDGMIVTAITPGGAMEKYFGLKRGDIIIEIAIQGGAQMPVSDMATASEAKDFLLSSYQNSQQITVIRNEQKVLLPAAPAAAQKPAPKTESSKDALQNQLDAIQGPR